MNDTPVWLIGLGVYLPEASLTNEEIERGMPWLDTSAQWIAEHTGIRKRHVAEPGQNAADLGYRAAAEAVELSGLEPKDIDLILLATNTSEFVYPAGAGRIQVAFGKDASGNMRMRRSGALDLQQGCSSFIGGIGMAAGLIRAKSFKNILVVGADVATRMVDWTDRDAILLGDAAAACVLTAEKPAADPSMPPLEILGHFMRTDASMAESIQQRGVLDRANNPFDHIEGQKALDSKEKGKALYGSDYQRRMQAGPHRFFEMDGRQVYKFVKRTVPRQGYMEVLRRSGLLGDAPAELGLDELGTIDEVKDREKRSKICTYLASKVDRFIPHSANLSLNQELAEEMEIPFERMYVTLQKYGNTSAASVGLSLYEALRGPANYTTLTKRDGKGEIKVPGREIEVGPLEAGHTALLLSFGAGNSWNYVLARRA